MNPLNSFIAALALTGAAVVADNAYSQPAPATYGAAPAPSYGAPAHGQTKRNCTIEFERAEVEVCIPSLQTSCEDEEITVKVPVMKEQCFDVTSTECKFEVSEEEVKICTYVYEKQGVEADAKLVDVKYTKRCDTQYVSICKAGKPKYGYASYKEECKEAPQEVCYNTPQANTKDKSVKMVFPKPVKKCETKKVDLPDIKCENKKEERCFKLPAMEESTKTIQKCTSELAEPRCSNVQLNLPAQTCVEMLDEYKTAIPLYQNPAPAPAPQTYAQPTYTA